MSIKRAANIFGMFLVLSTLTLFLSCGGGGSSSSSEPTKALTEEEGDSLAINEFWDSLENLYKTADPSDEALWEWLNSHATDDYFDAGFDKTDKLAEPPEGIEPGSTFSAAIIESVSSTKYAKVYRISLKINNGFEEQETIMAYDGTQWLWQGNQTWVNYDISAYAVMGFSYSGKSVCYSGFELELSGNRAALEVNNIHSAIVTGPGLPDEEIIFSFTGVDDDFDMWGNESALIFRDTSQDQILSAIPDNAEYTFKICSDFPMLITESSKALVWKSYKHTLKKGPVPKGSLTQDMFATPSSKTHDFSDLKFGGLVTLDVTIPTGVKPGWVMLGYTSDNGKEIITGYFETGGTSISIDTIGRPVPKEDSAELVFSVTDAYDREFITDWAFE